MCRNKYTHILMELRQEVRFHSDMLQSRTVLSTKIPSQLEHYQGRQKQHFLSFIELICDKWYKEINRSLRSTLRKLRIVSQITSYSNFKLAFLQ